jgi:hypothetical protein
MRREKREEGRGESEKGRVKSEEGRVKSEEVGGDVRGIMAVRWWKIILNPFFMLVLSVIGLVAQYKDSPFLKFVFIFLLISSIVISIIKSDEFYKNHLVISLILLIFITILSFFLLLMGFDVTQFILVCIWIIGIIFSLVAVILFIKKRKNYILNYIFLLSWFATLIGDFYVDIKIDYNRKELIYVAHLIDSHYVNTDKKYNYDEIIRVLGIYKKGIYKKINSYKISVRDDDYEIYIRTPLTGETYGLMYESSIKKIKELVV